LIRRKRIASDSRSDKASDTDSEPSTFHDCPGVYHHHRTLTAVDKSAPAPGG